MNDLLFGNNNQAVIRKLADRSIKSDKRSRAFLLLTIALAVCMVFSIFLVSTGTQEEYKNTQRGKAQIGILGITDEQLALLRQNENVSWVGEYSALGLFYEEGKTITVAYGNEEYFLQQEKITFQGDIPQSKNEIMLSQNYLDFLGEAYTPGDTILLDLTGTGDEAYYTLSAILDEDKESNGYFVYVSKELAYDLAGDTFQVTGYTRLNTDAIDSASILDVSNRAIKDTGIEEGQVNLTEYFAVMSGAIKSGMPIPVPLLAALTAVLAATIVYGVFYSKITKNVQMLGQLRTIGMTKRQIKRMAGKEGRKYAIRGIPLGLLCGVLIGFIGCPDGFRLKTAIFYAAVISVMAFITVNIAIFKPVRVAMNISPVEGSKYIMYAGEKKRSRKLHRKLTPFNLAKINIQRNKQKAVLTILMIGLSGAFLLVTATVAGSIDPEKQAKFKYYPIGEIQIQVKNIIGSSFDKEAEPYGSSKLQLEGNPLAEQALMQELIKIDGVEKITSSDCVYMTITFPGGNGSITSISNFFPTLNKEQIEEKQFVLSSGTVNYNDMVAQNGILVAEDIAKVGDTLKIEGRASDGSTYAVEAVVVGTYNRASLMESSPVIPGSPYFIMAYDTAKKMTGIIDQTGVLTLEVSDEHLEDVLSAVQKIADENGKIEVNTIKQTISSIQKYYDPSIKTFYMISAILFIFGAISLMNMLMVDFQNRKREFGLFEAVGTTQNQLKGMLNREIGIYGKPDYRLDFGRMKLDSWHVTHQEVPQFAKLKGHSYLDGQYLSLSCADFAEMYTGHHLWNNYRVTAVLKPVTGTEHFVNIRVQGAMRSYAAGFSKNNKLVLRKNYYGYTTLCETDFEWKVDEEYKISLTADGSTISVSVNDKEYLKFTDSDLPLLTGCAGISVEKGSHCLYRDIAITGRE